MTLIKFTTKNLYDYNVIKESDGIIIKLLYTDSDKENTIIRKFDTSKIHYWNFTNVGNLGWITFYELSEVFHIPPHEKAEILRNKKPTTNNETPDDKKNFNFSVVDDDESFDVDLNDLLKDLK